MKVSRRIDDDDDDEMSDKMITGNEYEMKQ